MKRVIKSNFNEKKFLIHAGVSIDDDSNVVFNWKSDSSSDIVSLATDSSGEFDNNGIRFVYGYEFTSSANGSDKKIFRDYIKGISDSRALYSENIQEFVERAVLRFDERYTLSNFGATVYIEPSKLPSLVDIMSDCLWEYMNNTPDLDLRLIKEAYKNVEFDSEKASKALRDCGMTERRIQQTIKSTLEKFDDLKKSNELFQIKRFIPRPIREGFFNFLKFKTEEEKETYRSLQGVNVLVFDDLLTSGSTVNEIIRYLKAINDENTLTVFVLIKQ